MIKLLIAFCSVVVYVIVGTLFTMLVNSFISDGYYRSSSYINDFTEHPIMNLIFIASWPVLAVFVIIVYICAAIEYVLSFPFKQLNSLQEKIDMFYIRYLKRGGHVK